MSRCQWPVAGELLLVLCARLVCTPCLRKPRARKDEAIMGWALVTRWVLIGLLRC